LCFHEPQKGNGIGAAGATAFAQTLMENKSITSLDLSSKCFFFFPPKHKDNGIGSGAIAIAQSLKKNTCLTALYLSGMCLIIIFYHLKGSYMGDTGASAFAQTMKESICITTLDLSGQHWLF
jgi:hypothetical protein